MSIVSILKPLNPYNRYFLYPMQAAVNEYEQRMERKMGKAEDRVAGQNEETNEANASSDTATTTTETPIEETAASEAHTEKANDTASEASKDSKKHNKHHAHLCKHHEHSSNKDKRKDKKDIFTFMKKKKDDDSKSEKKVSETSEEQVSETTDTSEVKNPDAKKFDKKHHKDHAHKNNNHTDKHKKDEEQEKAEAEYPTEPVGAEKMEADQSTDFTVIHPDADEKAEPKQSVQSAEGETTTHCEAAVVTNNDKTEAAKNGPVLIHEESDGIDFSILGGFKVGFDLMSDHRQSNRNQFNPVFDANGTPISEYISPQQPSGDNVQPFNPLFNQPAFVMNPMPNMNTYENMLKQQQVDMNKGQNFNPAIGNLLQQQQQAAMGKQAMNPVAGMGRHRSDNPPMPKPEEPKKAEPDKVDVESPEVARPFVQEKLPKKDMSELDCITQIPKTDPSEVTPKSLFPKNEEFYTRYSDLRTIENIALKNGYQVCFVMRPSQLIDCLIYDINGQYIPNKGFTIDPGHMYDGRWKIFPAILQYYEGVPPYHMYDRNVNRGGKKVRGPLHEEFIRDLIVGGNTAITAKPMYSTDEINLNSVVALITINKPNLTNDERKFIRNRILELYKSGAFDAYQNTKFKMADYDKESKTILLDNISTPKYYGAKPDPNVEHIQIKITPKNFQILKGDNLFPDPN